MLKKIIEYQSLNNIKEMPRAEKIILILISTLMILLIGKMDTIQQQIFAVVGQAYSDMNAQKYKDAIEKFRFYEEGHSNFYWKMIALFNSEEYEHENIIETIKECELLIQNSKSSFIIMNNRFRPYEGG